MKLEISLVPLGHIHEVISGVLPYLKESEAWTRGRSTVDDILRFLVSGTMQLWVVFNPEEGKIYGHIITEIKPYPQCRMLTIQYCAMEPNHMVYVEDRMQELAEKFAKDNGCSGIEFIGRPGWGKHIKKYGYDVQSVSYQKFFKEQAMSLLRWKQKLAPYGNPMDGGGGGGGSPAPTSQSVSQTTIPDYARPYVEKMLGQTAALTMGNVPYTPYAGQRFAGFTPMQAQAFQQAAGQQVAGQLGQATGLAGQIGAAGLGAGQAYGQMATSPQSMQAYMSPYMQNVVDYQKSEAMRDYGKQLPALQAQAVGQGAFGGNRLALQQAEMNRNLNKQLQGIEALGAQDAFKQAQQAQQFQAGLGMQGLGMAGQAASTLGALGQTQFGQETAITDAIARAGALQQAQRQRELEIPYQDYLSQLNYPYKQLGFMSDMFRGLPLSQTSQMMYQAPPSMLSQVAGAGATGLGLYGLTRKKGGPIKEKKEGSDLADLRLHKLVG